MTAARCFPTTGGQKRLWGLTRRNPGEWQDNLCAVHEIHGPVNPQWLACAVYRVRTRHDALRTSMRTRGDLLVQAVDPIRFRALRTVDVDAKVIAQHGGLSLFLSRWVESPFYLSSGPLWRFDLLRLEPERWLFIVRSHHIVSDGISMAIVWREVAEIYATLAAGDAPASPARRSFGDFARWLGQWTSDPRYTTPYERFWSETLASRPWPRLHWRQGRHATGFRGRAMRGTLPTACTRAVHDARDRWHVTDYVVALAAYFVVVHMNTGEADLAVISPFANRSRPGLQYVVGRLMTGHVVRYHFDPRSSAEHLLRSLGEHVAAILVHQDVPFEWLGERFGLTGREQLDQIRFSLEDHMDPGVHVGKAATRTYEYGSHSGPQRDLNLYVRAHADRWNVVVQFNEEVFDAESAGDMMNLYCAALLACARTGNEAIVEASMQLKDRAATRIAWKPCEGKLVDMLAFDELHM